MPEAPPDTNPKTVFGQAKPGIHAIPPVALLHCGRGMENGEGKYGLTNWRENEVSASVYYNAAFRHLAAWWDGEQVASDSGVHHLGHVMACCAILLDAEHMGQLNDNRPAVPGPFAQAVDEMTRPTGESQAEVNARLGTEGSEGSEGIDTEFEEIAARMVSCNTVSEAAGVLRAYMTGGWDDDDDFGEFLGEPVDWDDDTEDQQDARMVVGFEVPVSTATRFDHVGVEVRPDITGTELDVLIRDFLEGDRGSQNLAAFNNFRHHIGCFKHPLYSQNNRTRLAFYLEARIAGVSFSANEMDEALRQAGLEFGSV